MKFFLSPLLVISLATCIPLSLCAPSYEEQLFGIVVKERECAEKCSFNSDSLVLHDQKSFVQSINDLLRENDMSLVGSNRIRATAMLTKAAIMTCQGGDIVETGVFTGGSSATIMKVLMDFDRCNRTFWAFDSFEGLPDIVAQDNGGDLHVGMKGGFRVDQEKFISNMKKVKAWDSRLVVTKGWFKDTGPACPVKKISFLRLDGDLYSSTYDALSAFYDRVVHGGLIYVDDYGSFNGCREAIDEFRTQRRIFEPLHMVKEHSGSFEAVWWRKIGSS